MEERRRVSLQCRPPNDNSFVRLHPSTARALWQQALREGATTTADNTDTVWTVTQEQGQSTQVTSGIEFLPLEIEVNDTTILYASYNGGDLETGTCVTSGVS